MKSVSLLALAALVPSAALGCDLPEGPLTLDAAMRHALCANPAIARARSNVETRSASLDNTRAARRPTLSASFGRVLTGFQDDTAHSHTDTAYSSFAATWTVYDSGARLAAIRSAQAQLDSAMLQDSDTRADLMLTAALAWLDAAVAEERLTAANASVKNYSELLEIVQHRRTAGQVTGADVMQAEAQLHQAIYNRETIEIGLQAARHELGRSMGDTYASARPLSGLKTALDQFAAMPLPDLRAAEQLLESSPTLRSVAARIASAQADVDAARAIYSPVITLSAEQGYGWEKRDGHKSDWSIRAALSIPLYTGGSRDARIREAASSLHFAQAERDVVRDQLLAQLRTHHARATLASGAVRSARASVQAATTAVGLSMGRYRVGAAALQEVTQAETTSAQAALTLAEARASRLEALLNLHYLTGMLTMEQLGTYGILKTEQPGK